MKKKILISILLIFVALIILSNLLGKGCIVYHEGSFKGKVVDAETKEPIEGAVVVAIYYVREYSFIESNSAPVDAKEVLTNKNGDFNISPHVFFNFYPLLLATKATTQFLIYKPGYTHTEGPDYIQLPDGYILRPNYPMIAEALRKGAAIELAKLNTWEERDRANMISIGDIPKRKWPLLSEMIEREEEWMNNNKGWQREEK